MSMKVRSSIYLRYVNSESFHKISVFKGSRGWKRIEPGGYWFGIDYPTWEAAMRGEQ